MTGIAAFEIVEVLHFAVAPDNGPAAVCVTCEAYHLAPFVNPVSLADVVSREFGEILDATALSPEESAETLLIGAGVRLTGKSGDIALFIDRRGRGPMGGAKVADLDHLAFVPERRHARRMSSDRLVAPAGNANYLPPVIDSYSGAGGVAWERKQLIDFDIVIVSVFVFFQVPDDSREPEDLRVLAPLRVTNRSVRPPDHLTSLVGGGGKAVVPTQRGKLLHHSVSVIPHKPKTFFADNERAVEESRTTPTLAFWLRLVGLGDAHDNTSVVFHRPCHAAIRSAERAEGDQFPISPQRGLPALVSRHTGIARHPAAVIDAVAAAARPSQRWEPDYMVFPVRRPSGQCRPKVDADENGRKNEAGSYGHISSPYVVAGVNDTASERRLIATVRSHRRSTCREVESLLLLCGHDFSSSENQFVVPPLGGRVECRTIP